MREDPSRASSGSPRANSPWDPTKAPTTNGRHIESMSIPSTPPPTRHRRSVRRVHARVRSRRAGHPRSAAGRHAGAGIVVSRAGRAVRLARRRAAARARPASGHAGHACRRHRVLPLAERPDRPAGAAADRSGMGARRARRTRRGALPVGQRRRRVARELPARSRAQAPSRHAAGRLLSAQRLQLYDMAGNVWQWVADWYRADAYRTNGESATRAVPAAARCASCAADRGSRTTSISCAARIATRSRPTPTRTASGSGSCTRTTARQELRLRRSGSCDQSRSRMKNILSRLLSLLLSRFRRCRAGADRLRAAGHRRRVKAS